MSGEKRPDGRDGSNAYSVLPNKSGYRTGLVAALDVGSSKIVCLIGRAEPGSLRVLGAALRESAGIKAGTVTSLELAEESIRDCGGGGRKPCRCPHPECADHRFNCGQPCRVSRRAT